MKRLFALVALATLAACSSSTEPKNPTAASIAGTWQLRTMGGAPLPFLLQSGSTRVNITKGTLNITDGGSWSETVELSVSVNGAPAQVQTTAVSGSYSRVGQVIALQATNGVTAHYVFDGSSLTGQEAPVEVYTR